MIERYLKEKTYNLEIKLNKEDLILHYKIDKNLSKTKLKNIIRSKLNNYKGKIKVNVMIKAKYKVARVRIYNPIKEEDIVK